MGKTTKKKPTAEIEYEHWRTESRFYLTEQVKLKKIILSGRFTCISQVALNNDRNIGPWKGWYMVDNSSFDILNFFFIQNFVAL